MLPLPVRQLDFQQVDAGIQSRHIHVVLGSPYLQLSDGLAIQVMERQLVNGLV